MSTRIKLSIGIEAELADDNKTIVVDVSDTKKQTLYVISVEKLCDVQGAIRINVKARMRDWNHIFEFDGYVLEEVYAYPDTFW